MIKLKNLISEVKLPNNQEEIFRKFGYEWDSSVNLYRSPDPDTDYLIGAKGDGTFYWNHYDTGQWDDLYETFSTFEELIEFLKIL